MTTVTSTESPAAFAWAALAAGRAGEAEVLDWLREQLSSDDAKAVKRAFYAAAADAIRAAVPNDLWPMTTARIHHFVAEGRFGKCHKDIAALMKWIRDVFRDGSLLKKRAAAWVGWIKTVERALTTCRRIEGLPE